MFEHQHLGFGVEDLLRVTNVLINLFCFYIGAVVGELAAGTRVEGTQARLTNGLGSSAEAGVALLFRGWAVLVALLEVGPSKGQISGLTTNGFFGSDTPFKLEPND